MKQDDEKLADLAEHSIRRQAGLLDKEIQPETELWPRIEAAIKNLPQQEVINANTNRWMPMAMAASLLLAIGSLGFAGYTSYSVNQNTGTFVAEESTLNLIEQPYMVARTGYLTSLVTDEQQMSPEVREVLKKNLKIIDDAAREIHKALEENPNDPFLTDALLLTRQKEMDLLNQVASQGPDTI